MDNSTSAWTVLNSVVGVLSVILLVGNVLQFLQSIATGSSLRVKAQADYNNWFRVAEIADQIKANPENAAELIRHISGMADMARNEIVAYSQEKLKFTPWFNPASKPGPNPSPPQTFLQKAKAAFVPK
ncbi:MAG: hypothetical protein ABSH01_28115 [Terriglobia bacterium]|jgi:heme/copper-type cytochrome/quinol oxidase subunit 1